MVVLIEGEDVTGMKIAPMAQMKTRIFVLIVSRQVISSIAFLFIFNLRQSYFLIVHILVFSLFKLNVLAGNSNARTGYAV